MADSVLAKIAVDISSDTSKFSKPLKTAESNLNSFSKGITTSAGLIKGLLAGAFAGLSFAALGKSVIDTASKFQTFEAVLKNTLGSQSAAQIALRDIQNFAAQTPFAVDELTSSFVKLANQGFTPTTEELRKLGDLASSTGKGFDQLAEAIIDAQTGEFERLKEFGVRAQKQGDQVKFTFKGVETQTKFTSAAIREYLLSLGDAEGVTGSMAAISKTLGGQISNLGDSWTNFLKVIGDGNKGALSGATTALSTLLTKVTGLLKTQGQVQDELKVDAQSKIIEELKDYEKITGDIEGSAFKLKAQIDDQITALSEQALQYSINDDAGREMIEGLNRQALVLVAEKTAIDDYVASSKKQAEATADAAKKHDLETAAIKKKTKAKKEEFAPGTVGAYEEAISKLNKELQRTNVTDIERIRILSAETDGYSEAIDKVEKLKAALAGMTDLVPKVPTTLKGKNSLFDGDAFLGTLNNKKLDKEMKALEKSLATNGEKLAKSSQKIAVGISGPISQGVSSIAEALGNAFAGVGNFGDAVLEAVLNFAKQLGEILIATGVGVIAADLLLNSPYTAIAAGIALVALATGAKAAISKAHKSSVGGGASAFGPATTTATRFQSFSPESTQSTVTFEIQGKTLVGVLANQTNANGRLRG